MEVSMAVQERDTVNIREVNKNKQNFFLISWYLNSFLQFRRHKKFFVQKDSSLFSWECQLGITVCHPPVLRNAFGGAGQKGVILISIGGIGSADKGLAFFPPNEAEMPIHRTGAGLFPCISLRA